MRFLWALSSYSIVAFVAYTFGRWVKRGDRTVDKYAAARTIADLQGEVAELREELAQHDRGEREAVWS